MCLEETAVFLEKDTVFLEDAAVFLEDVAVFLAEPAAFREEPAVLFPGLTPILRANVALSCVTHALTSAD